MFKVTYSIFYIETVTHSHRTGRELKKPRTTRNYVDITEIDNSSQDLVAAIIRAKSMCKTEGWKLYSVEELEV